jgi:hypothetical protein
MGIYVILLICFFVFGYNAGLNGAYTQLIEVGLSIAVFAAVIMVFVGQGFLPGIVATFAGFVAGKTGYEMSPKLR